jgi:DNA processing protein
MGYGPLHTDELLARSGLETHVLQARLLELELAGAVVRLPGGRYQANAASR